MFNGDFAQPFVRSMDTLLSKPSITDLLNSHSSDTIKSLGAGLIIVFSPIIGGFLGACIDWIRKGDRESGRYKPRGNLFFILGLAAGTAISISVLYSMTH